jgi:hypothetical protein
LLSSLAIFKSVLAVFVKKNEVFEGDVNQITIQKDDTLLKQTKEQWVYIAFYLTAELQKVKNLCLGRQRKESPIGLYKYNSSSSLGCVEGSGAIYQQRVSWWLRLYSKYFT